MRIADLEFINCENANKTGVGLQLVENDTLVFFNLHGIRDEELEEILNYKSFTYKSWQKGRVTEYFVYKYGYGLDSKVVWCYAGFSPILIRLLRNKYGYIVNGNELYRAREIERLPNMKFSLWDFQRDAIESWIKAGCYGILACPTASGKCCKSNTLILTDNGLIKIKDIIKGVSNIKYNKESLDYYMGDEKSDDEKIKVVSVQGDSNYNINLNKFEILNKYDMGVNDVITIKTKIGIEICGTPEHKIIIIDNNGNINFKMLKDITNEDNIAINYNTNIYNEKLELNHQFTEISKYAIYSNVTKNVKYMNKEIARLLGYAISEGNVSGNSFIITSFDEEMQIDIIKICEGIGLKTNYRLDGNKNDGKPVGIIISSVEFIDFIRHIGYIDLSKNKEVPWSILQSNKECQIEFLKAMFDGDGTLGYENINTYEKSEYQKMSSIEYSSSSYELCRQLQLMLLNIGIISNLNEKKGSTNEYRGELKTYEKSYRTIMYGSEVLKYAKEIGFNLTRKKELLNEFIRVLETKKRHSEIVYPNIKGKLNILHKKLIEKAKERNLYIDVKVKYPSGAILSERKYFSYTSYLKYNNFKYMDTYISGVRSPSKDTLEYILKIFEPVKDNNWNYLNELKNKFIFDHVKSITNGKEHVYDMTINEVHSYIGNGVINHNSIIGCSIIKKMNVRTIILVHTADLLINVWFNYLTQQFGEDIKDRIGIIGGGLSNKDRKMMRIIGNDFSENIKKDIVIATSQSLLAGNKLSQLGKEHFGLMITDECLPYNTSINTSKGVFKIGELYNVYNNESDKYLIEKMKINSLDLSKKEIIKCNFIPKKTIIKKMYELKTEIGIKFILSDDHKCLNRNKEGIVNYNESKSIKNVAYSLLRNYNMDDLCIKARLFGYMLGDGHIRDTYQTQIYGNYDDMMKVKEDLYNIGYEIEYVRDMKDVKSKILTEDGEILNICGDVCTIGINSSFGHQFHQLGYPTGKKTNKTYIIPEWIMNGSFDIKKEFLSGYMGAEGSKIRERIKRCFEVIRVSYRKREDLVGESIIYVKQLVSLFNEFDVNISDITVKNGNVRKDGTISKNIVMTFSNENNSMINLLDIGYRYCKEREISGEIARQYMLYSKISNDKVKKTYDYVIELYKKGVSGKKVVDTIQSINDKKNLSLIHSFNDKELDVNEMTEKKYCYVNKSTIDHWISPKRSVNLIVHETKSKINIMEFEEWTKKVDGDVIFLDIISKKFTKEEQGYDLEILNDNHNYFIEDGINVHNCHHYSADQFRKVASAIRAVYRLGLSATLNRSDGLSPVFHALLGDVRYKIGIKELAKKGLLVEPIFYSIIIEDDEACNKIRMCRYKLLEYSRYVKKVSGSSELKFRYILGLCKSLKDKGKKFMLYTDFVNRSGMDEDGVFDAESVFTRDDYVKGLIELKIKVVGISSKMSGIERQSIFSKLGGSEFDGIVFGSLGSEGINIPEVEAIVLANATASTIRFPQRVGRAMRLYKNKITGNIKKNCYVYEILLNVPKELEWAEKNFLEYEQDYKKEIIRVNNDGYLIKKDIKEIKETKE